jgi:hypothetical protein
MASVLCHRRRRTKAPSVVALAGPSSREQYRRDMDRPGEEVRAEARRTRARSQELRYAAAVLTGDEATYWARESVSVERRIEAEHEWELWMLDASS